MHWSKTESSKWSLNCLSRHLGHPFNSLIHSCFIAYFIISFFVIGIIFNHTIQFSGFFIFLLFSHNYILLWTGVIDRVRGVLVWSRPLCSGSSPRTSGMPVWWVPWHGSVARSRQLGRCTMYIDVVGSASASLRRVCRRREDFNFFRSSLRTSSCAQNAHLRRAVMG